MNIQRKQSGRAPEGGMVTIIFIALLGIMLILVTAESRALLHLHREVRLIEQKQILRLNGPLTNSVHLTGRAELPLGQPTPQIAVTQSGGAQ